MSEDFGNGAQLERFAEQFRALPIDRQLKAWTTLQTLDFDTTARSHPTTQAIAARMDELSRTVAEQRAILSAAPELGPAGAAVAQQARTAISALVVELRREDAKQNDALRISDSTLWDITARRDEYNRRNRERARMARDILDALPRDRQLALLASMEQRATIEPGDIAERQRFHKRLTLLRTEHTAAVQTLARAAAALHDYEHQHPLRSRWSATTGALREQLVDAAKHVGAAQHALSSATRRLEQQLSRQRDLQRWERGILSESLPRQRAMASDPAQRLAVERAARSCGAQLEPHNRDFGLTFSVVGTAKVKGQPYALIEASSPTRRHVSKAGHDLGSREPEHRRLLVPCPDAALLTKGGRVIVTPDMRLHAAPSPSAARSRGHER